MTILNLPGIISISRTYSGDPAEAGKARRFVAAVLDSAADDARATDGHPCRDDAVQLIGELIAESLRHAAVCGSRAGYLVSVWATADWSRVTLSTRACGCWTSPELTPGRGVRLVDLFTMRWGVSTSRGGVSVWFELGHGEPSPAGQDRRVSTERVGTERGTGDPGQR